jgi:hypothetical protein
VTLGARRCGRVQMSRKAAPAQRRQPLRLTCGAQTFVVSGRWLGFRGKILIGSFNPSMGADIFPRTSSTNLVEPRIQYDQFTVSPHAAAFQNTAFPSGHFGPRIDSFDQQGFGCYPPSPLSLPRQAPKERMIAMPDRTTLLHRNNSTGIYGAYGYSIDLLNSGG